MAQPDPWEALLDGIAARRSARQTRPGGVKRLVRDVA
jgi:hypothetical protein